MAEDKSVYDLIVDEMRNRQRLVKDELHLRFKKTRPFRTEPVSPGKELDYYNSLTPEDMKQMIDEQGPDKVNSFIQKMETKKMGG